VEEPYRVTPRFALRIGMMGMLAVAIFAVLFLRLWSLQILNGDQLLRAAQNNQRRDVRVQGRRRSRHEHARALRADLAVRSPEAAGRTAS
jgi:cell division protein FtsI/penicillin-binding protein 2